MTTVKFDKSVKYRGVRYAAHEAFKVEDEDVVELKKVGATVLAVEAAADEEVDGAENGQDSDEAEDEPQCREELLKYTTPELVQFAQKRGIDLQGKTRKADIYNIIVAALN